MPVAHQVKIWFGLFLIVRTILQSPPTGLRKIFIDYFCFQADQWDCTKSSKFLIDLLPLNNVSERAKIVACQFPTRRLVNQRNPSGNWQVTGSDLADRGQIMSFYFGFFPS